MEALAAVGLAGNIVQFIDFSCKLFEQGTSIYHSRSGLSQSANNLASITQKLQALSATLCRRESRARRFSTILQQHEIPLQNIAQECQAAATELLSALHSLKAKDPSSKWSSFRAALCSIWKQSRVDDLGKKLDMCRTQLSIQLQVIQDDKAELILSQIDKLDRRSRVMGADMSHQIYNIREEVQYAVQMLRAELANRDGRRTKSWQGVTTTHASASDIDVFALAQSLIQSEQSGANMIASLNLLDSLAFQGMDFRYSKIHDAHPQTFAQVYETYIVPWLLSSRSSFWISGKPGSGKSTLMKYIVDNFMKCPNLYSQPDKQAYIVASYFFWINGTETQRSQEGLLRSLLHDILRMNPDLIELALPDSWELMTRLVYKQDCCPYDWKQAELLAAFQRLANSGREMARLCIFIDGLDEYEGDEEELIAMIRHLETMKIKICVSSRPWNVFEEAFGQRPDSKIYLEKLNKGDIQRYVNDKLRSRQEFQPLQVRATDAEKIVDEIVKKSQGVFLWVFLVVRSLIDGLRNHDRLSQLQKRLSDIPSDLEAFFRHMFYSLDSTYRTQTAHMLRVTLSANQTLSALAYWFLDEQEDDPSMALTMPLRGLTTEDVQERTEQIRIRINGRYKGLLEITPDEWRSRTQVVDFLHRTVRDFLMTPEIQKTLLAWQDTEFDPHLAICKASLAEIKSIATMTAAESPPVHGAVEIFFRSARELEVKNQETPMTYLEELERVCNEYKEQDPLTLRRMATANPWDPLDGPDFLDVAIYYNLCVYVSARLTSLPHSSGNLTPCHSRTWQTRQLSLEMTCLILSCGSPSGINRTLQYGLVNRLREMAHDELLVWIKEICTVLPYATISEDGRYSVLHEILQNELSPTEIQELTISADIPHRKGTERNEEKTVGEERKEEQACLKEPDVDLAQEVGEQEQEFMNEGHQEIENKKDAKAKPLALRRAGKRLFRRLFH